MGVVKCLVCLCMVLCLVQGVEQRSQTDIFTVFNDAATFTFFQEWQAKHGKVYRSSGETIQRYKHFVDNLKIIDSLNEKREQPEDATFGPTQFADLSAEEFRNTVLMSPRRPSLRQKTYNISRPVKVPESFDWTAEKGVVTSVKNQGHDGTCWAFAGLANVESLWSIRSGKLSPDLSTQSFNDCDGLSDPYKGAVTCGPLGATMAGFYLWAIEEGGVMTWDDYPYCVGFDECSPCQPQGYSEEWCGGEWPIKPCKEEESCAAKYDRSKFVPDLTIKDFGFLTQDEELLKDALIEIGPVVAGIDATDIQHYTGAVLSPDKCSVDTLNHAVLLVGYGGQDGKDFWKAKNSWGTSWGEDGFFRIRRNPGACGINVDCSTAILG